jgi:hypothetical protein
VVVRGVVHQQPVQAKYTVRHTTPIRLSKVLLQCFGSTKGNGFKVNPDPALYGYRLFRHNLFTNFFFLVYLIYNFFFF